MRNFLATPTFVFYKRGHVSVPFIYNDNFHPNRFLDFITTTSEIKLIEDGSFRMHLEAQRKVQTFIQKELSRSHQ